MTPSKPRRKRNYQAHGLYALQRAMEGVRDLDKWLEDQGEAGEHLRKLRAQMIREQGGESVITALERLNIDATLKTHIYLFMIDDFLLREQGTPVNRRDRRLFPVALQRAPFYEAVMKAGPILDELRKNRPKKEPILLPDYVKSKTKPTHELAASGQDGNEATA